MNIEKAMEVMRRGGKIRCPSWNAAALYWHIANVAVSGRPIMKVCVRLSSGVDDPVTMNGADLMREDYQEVPEAA